MAWIVVPNLLELREQLNKIAPNRDKASDGTVGDYNHSKSDSSHNPDDTGRGNAEWDSDPDGKEEIRAIDLDIDFKVPGLTAQKFVDHLVKYAKNGTFWWIRYIVYNRKMYHRRNGFAARDYGGSNPHDKHIHVNSDFSQRADDVKNVNYRLHELLPKVEAKMDEKSIVSELLKADIDPGTSTYSLGGVLWVTFLRTSALTSELSLVKTKADLQAAKIAELEAKLEAGNAQVLAAIEALRADLEAPEEPIDPDAEVTE